MEDLSELYYTESLDLFDLSEAELDALFRENSHESFLERCAETAWRVLQDAGVMEAVSSPNSALPGGARPSDTACRQAAQSATRQNR